MNDETVAVPRAATRTQRGFRAIGAVWVALRQVFFGVLPAAGIAALLFLLIREMRRDDIEVAPIAVPARLTDAGLSAEVVALRLLDQLEAAARFARTESVDRPTTELAGAQPDFNVPIAGLSLRSTAQLLRRVLGYRERRVTGEVVLEPGEKLSLRLRLSGHGQIADLRGYAVADIETLLRDAAPLIWRPLSPRLYAWWVADGIADQQQVRDRLAALRRVGVSVDAETARSIAFLTARSLVRSGRARDALPQFDALVESHPGWAAAWSGRALARAALYQLPAAVDDLRRAVALDPLWVAGHAQLARVLRDSNKPTEALAAADVALKLDPEDFDALYARANALRDLRRRDEAVAAAQQLMARHGGNPMSHVALGLALLRRNDRAEALAAFDAGLVAHARHGELLVGRAEALRALNRLDEALAVLDALTATAGAGWTAHDSRGWLLRRLGRHAEALGAFEEAIQRRPNVVWPNYGRAATLISLGRRDEGLAALQLVVAVDVDNLTEARADLWRLQAP